MAADLLGSMRVEIVGDNSKLDKSITESEKKTKKFGESTAKLGSTLGKLFTGIGFALVSKKLFELGKQAEKLFQVQETAEAKLDQTLKATGFAAGLTAEELKKMASELQEVTKFGDEATIGAQSLLLTFKDIGGDVFPRALESILDVSEAMGQDLKTSTIQIGKALNDPVAGLAALSRVGIQFTDVQKDLIKGFQESGDISSAQGVILKELESQFGGVAKAAALTAEGVSVQLNNSFGDLLETIGGVISEGLTPYRANLKLEIESVNDSIKAHILRKKALNGEALLVETLTLKEIEQRQQKRELAAAEANLALELENVSRNRAVDDALAQQNAANAEANVRSIQAEIAQIENNIEINSRQQASIKQTIKEEELALAANIKLAEGIGELTESTEENTEAQLKAAEELEEAREQETQDFLERNEAKQKSNEEYLRNYIETTEAEVAAAEEAARRKIELAQEAADATIGFLGAIDSLASATAAAELQRLEESGASEEELAKKRKEIAISEAKRKKAIGTFNTIVDTASAIVGFLANPGGIPGTVLSVAAGVTGAIELAAIAATPLPSFAEGGIIPGRPSKIDNTIANVASGELVANQDQKDRMLMSFLNGQGTGGGTTIVNAMVDKKVLFSIMLNGSKTGQLTLNERSIVK
jgi:hypothetical protein